MRIVLDLETTGTADLRLTGAQAYAEHPDTKVPVLCWAKDDDPVHTWRWCDGVLSSIMTFKHYLNLGAVFVAHNYLFEWNVWHAKMVPMGFPPIPIRSWSCTMARSL